MCACAYLCGATVRSQVPDSIDHIEQIIIKQLDTGLSRIIED